MSDTATPTGRHPMREQLDHPKGVDHEAHVQGASERAGEILPWVHVVISNRKAWLLGAFRGVSPEHLARYLLEFTYRLNRRGMPIASSSTSCAARPRGTSRGPPPGGECSHDPERRRRSRA